MRNVEIFTKSACKYCLETKKLLRSRGIAFFDHDVITTSHGRDAFRKRFQRHKTVPQIVIDGVHIGGHTQLVEYFKKLDEEALKAEQQAQIQEETSGGYADDF